MKSENVTLLSILLSALLSVISLSLQAHPGHAEASWVLHDLAHAVWIICGVMLLGGLALFLVVKRNASKLKELQESKAAKESKIGRSTGVKKGS